jgi:hypothetical protein
MKNVLPSEELIFRVDDERSQHSAKTPTALPLMEGENGVDNIFAHYIQAG